jgi:hypothetical protein
VRISLGVLLLSTLAFADGYQGTGRISLMPSFRATNQDPFYDAAGALGHTRAGGISGGPGLLGDFAYAATENIEVVIDPFFATEELHLKDVPSIRSYVYGAMVGAKVHIDIQDTWYPFLGLNSGPLLVYAGAPPDIPYSEAVAQVWAVSAGLIWRFSDSWGAVAQYAYFYGGELGTPLGTVLGRGHWASIGLTYYFPRSTDPSGMDR